MSECRTCIHVVKDGNKPVGCLALIEYGYRKTCVFYEVHPRYYERKEGVYFVKPLWNKNTLIMTQCVCANPTLPNHQKKE